MRLERLNNIPLNTVTPNFVAIFVFFGTASSFTERISFSEIETKRETILFLLGCTEVNSTWIITSGLANQGAPKALFTCVVYTKGYYCHNWRVKNHILGPGVSLGAFFAVDYFASSVNAKCPSSVRNFSTFSF